MAEAMPVSGTVARLRYGSIVMLRHLDLFG